MEKPNSYIFNSKTFFKVLAISVFIFIICGITFNFLFEKYVIFNSPISGAYKINRILNKTPKNEIAIFGSSRAQGCYVPSILGENYFNYGIDGIQDNITLFFLEEELKKDKNNPIIYNLDLNGFSISNGDILNYIPSINNGYLKNEIGDDYGIYMQIPFLKYYGNFEWYVKYYLQNKMNLTKVTDNGGSFEKNSKSIQQWNKTVQLRNETITKFHNHKVLLSKFESLLKSTNRNIFIVIAPVHKSFFSKYESVIRKNDFLSQLNKTHKNITVFDHSEEKYPDSLFFDTLHLNYKGAQKFSQQLRKDIQNKSL